MNEQEKLEEIAKNKREVLDIVDENDVVIGSAPRNEIYKKKLRHRIVHIFLFDKKGRMALQLRGHKTFFFPNSWSTAVGGHVSSGESCEEAALREFEEELGTSTKLEYFAKDLYKAEGIPEKFLVSFKAVYEGDFPKLEEGKVVKVEYFTLDEIKEMISNKEKFHPELLFLLKKHWM